MIQVYKVSGMTCAGCKTTVDYLLKKVNGVTGVGIDLEKGEVTLSMEHHIETGMLQKALEDYPKYQLTEKQGKIIPPLEYKEDQRSWTETYKPVLLIFTFITVVTLLIQLTQGSFQLMQWMNHFMAGFFLVFSFFKLLNLQGFADSYVMYDIVAKRWKGYGYVYAFIELGLGMAYLSGISPFVINSITVFVMSISLIGVLQSVLNKSKIKCACLGDVFNLPMSTITIIEDGLMILMSLSMIVFQGLT